MGISTSQMIRAERIKTLNDQPIRPGRYVLYWMQASQRAEYNHALEYAVIHANRLHQPLVVYFGLTDKFPEANERQYYFMLEGLKEVRSALADRGITMIVRHNWPPEGAALLSGDASLVVVDRGYLRIQRQWREEAAKRINCALFQVESDVIVPVEAVSQREEYSARTFRPKIQKQLPKYLIPLTTIDPDIESVSLDLEDFAIEDTKKAIISLDIDRSVSPSIYFRGGIGEAKKRLNAFIESKLDGFPQYRNDPARDYHSDMSPYLHFGQISPLFIALEIIRAKSPGKDAYLEELITRRELSVNFIYYNQQYDSFSALPLWARRTLSDHKGDKREYIYSLEEMENAKTHDAYWNSAQDEMRITGKMHGYMRMYWGKKILEWSKSPEQGFLNALFLNNKYELDGRDPNGYTGVAWCFGKHDRAWAERQIFGKVRYMSKQRLETKFDMDGYVQKIRRP